MTDQTTTIDPERYAVRQEPGDTDLFAVCPEGTDPADTNTLCRGLRGLRNVVPTLARWRTTRCTGPRHGRLVRVGYGPRGRPGDVGSRVRGRRSRSRPGRSLI